MVRDAAWVDEVNRLLDEMEQCVERVKALRIEWEYRLVNNG